MPEYSRALKIAHLMLPPIVFKLARHLRTAQWEYVANDWPKNDRRSTGWDDPSVVNTMRDEWQAYVCGTKSAGPLAFWPWKSETRSEIAHNLLMTYGYVLGRVAHNKTRLSLLDWGGALGHYALISRALLPEISLDYTVKERPDLCALGRQLLPDVRFVSSDDECFSRHYQLVMASGAFQYVEDWRTLAHRLANAAEPWLFIANVPMVHRAAQYVAVQRPLGTGLRTEYISWVFNRGEFISYMQGLGFVVEREFLGEAVTYHRKAVEHPERLSFLLRRS